MVQGFFRQCGPSIAYTVVSWVRLCGSIQFCVVQPTYRFLALRARGGLAAWPSGRHDVQNLYIYILRFPLSFGIGKKGGCAMLGSGVPRLVGWAAWKHPNCRRSTYPSVLSAARAQWLSNLAKWSPRWPKPSHTAVSACAWHRSVAAGGQCLVQGFLRQCSPSIAYSVVS